MVAGVLSVCNGRLCRVVCVCVCLWQSRVCFAFARLQSPSTALKYRSSGAADLRSIQRTPNNAVGTVVAIDRLWVGHSTITVSTRWNLKSHLSIQRCVSPASAMQSLHVPTQQSSSPNLNPLFL